MAQKKGRGMLRMVTLVVLVILLGGGYMVFSALFRQKTVIPPEKIAAVKKEDIVRSVVATGKIEPVTRVDIKSKASGIIRTILVNEGDRVTKGQVLLELDREMLAASLRESRALMMARVAMREKAEAERRSAGLALEKAREEAKTARPEFAERDLRRMQKLSADRLISTSVLEEAEQRFREEDLRRSVLQKEALVRESALYSAQKGVHQAEADYHAAEAVSSRCQEDLANATIRSPIDGIVLKRFLEPGDAVSSILALGSNATLIMVVGDTRELFFKGEVDESDIGRVREGLPAKLKVETFRDRGFDGEVFRISPMGQEKDNVTRFEVRIRITGDAAALRTSMTANAEIILEKKANVLIVPESAVMYDAAHNATVDVLNTSGPEQTTRRVPLKVGIRNGSRAEVLAGLKEGDQVILQ